MTEPLKPGARVFHGGQIWARSLPGGTGEVIRVEGPDHRGDYEYLVRCGHDFSRRTGTDNPETDERWWASYSTNPDELVEWRAKEAAQRAREQTRRELEHVLADNPRAAYFQFAKTWGEAAEMDRKNGDDLGEEG